MKCHTRTRIYLYVLKFEDVLTSRVVLDMLNYSCQRRNDMMPFQDLNNAIYASRLR